MFLYFFFSHFVNFFLIYVRNNYSCLQIFVFFPNEPKLNVKITKRYAERMRTENVLRGIIVAKDAATPIAKRAIEDLSQKYYIEVFLVRLLFYIYILCACIKVFYFLSASTFESINYIFKYFKYISKLLAGCRVAGKC